MQVLELGQLIGGQVRRVRPLLVLLDRRGQLVGDVQDPLQDGDDGVLVPGQAGGGGLGGP